MRLFFRSQAVPEPPEPGDGADFADVLAAQADETLPAPARDAGPLAEAMESARVGLAHADNLGRTGDERDFYTHLDALSTGVAKTFPESYCKSGCSGCCYYPIAMFTTSYTEWAVVRRYIEEVWTDADREAFVARYKAMYTPFWKFAIGYLQYSTIVLLATAPLVYRQRIHCPFLVDRKCTVYPARPYQCRTFGLFSVRSWGREPKLYACTMQGENLLERLAEAGPQVQLPVMNPIVTRLRKLCRGPRLALPIWAGIWVRRHERLQAAADRVKSGA